MAMALGPHHRDSFEPLSIQHGCTEIKRQKYRVTLSIERSTFCKSLIGSGSSCRKYHMNGLIPFERTIEQTTEKNSYKIITVDNKKKNYKLTTAAILPH